MPSYKSYCWGLGTTSFRMVEFNKKIEKQLRLLKDFWSLNEYQSQNWTNNNYLQACYYDYLHSQGFIDGEASLKDKDAREKTSGLVDFGLIDSNRRLTQVGEHLLEISENQNYQNDNILQISSDSFIYFKQLLKFSNVVSNECVRPYLVLAYTLSQLSEISKDEFTYLLPLATNQTKLLNIVDQIIRIRENQTTIDDCIVSHLMDMDNYQEAYDLFVQNNVNEELIKNIGMNRKSRNYDKPYFNLYKAIFNFVGCKNDTNVIDILNSLDKINGKAKTFWKQYIFNTSSTRKIKENGIKSINIENPLFVCDNETIFKDQFFKLLHLFKAKSLLSDYYDLNKRYFKTSNTILFQDNKVKFDIIPNCFFKTIGNDLLEICFQPTNLLSNNCELATISDLFNVTVQQIFSKVQEIYDVQARNLYDIQNFIENDRYSRFNYMLDTQFTDNNLIYLLNLFENRNNENDSIIQNMVSNNADIPTIFEYILAIIWYKISDRQGKVLEFMNLSLDADLLPISHASGGHEDITFKYETTQNYPKHTLLIEATLANGTNQRRMEMEPVSRHLGEYLLSNKDERAYCIFATTYLHINVISDFRMRKIAPYYSSNGENVINGMKIIPLQTTELKAMIQNNIHYAQLYSVFEGAYNSNKEPNRWYQEEIVDKI